MSANCGLFCVFCASVCFPLSGWKCTRFQSISAVIYFDCRPYDGKWSKSMIGYGAEDSHFVLELTYNYGIGNYQLGNDFQVNVCVHPSSMSCGNHTAVTLVDSDDVVC